MSRAPRRLGETNLIGPEAGRKLGRPRISRTAQALQRVDRHNAAHRIHQEQAAAGERRNGHLVLPDSRQLHDAAAPQSRQDPELGRRRAQHRTIPPKQIPRGALGDAALGRDEQCVLCANPPCAPQRPAELLAARCLVGIRSVRFLGNDDGRSLISVDVAGRHRGAPVAQLEAHDVVSRTRGEPYDILEAIHWLDQVERRAGCAESCDMAAEPGDPPVPHSNRLDQSDLNRRPRPPARHAMKYYIWSDLWGEAPCIARSPAPSRAYWPSPPAVARHGRSSWDRTPMSKADRVWPPLSDCHPAISPGRGLAPAAASAPSPRPVAGSSIARPRTGSWSTCAKSIRTRRAS